MSGQASDIPEFAKRFEAAEPRKDVRAGIVLGVAIAALASGGLAWWLSGDDRGRMLSRAEATPAVNAPAPPRTPALATASADPAQVRRAYEQVRNVYAEGGAAGLVSFSQECAETVDGDPRILDFCLAFDMYAAALSPKEGEAAQWFQVGEARRLRLVRDALPPDADAEARVAEVAQLMREAVQTPQTASVPPAGQPVAAPTPPVPATPPVKRVSAPAPKPKAAPDRCKSQPTPARRLICAHPDLQSADRRLQRAYRRAIEAGADRQILEGEQAAWTAARNRTANAQQMAHLYALRLKELEQHVAEANSPPL